MSHLVACGSVWWCGFVAFWVWFGGCRFVVCGFKVCVFIVYGFVIGGIGLGWV